MTSHLCHLHWKIFCCSELPALPGNIEIILILTLLSSRYSIHLFVLVMMNYGIMNMASIPNIHRWAYVAASLQLPLWRLLCFQGESWAVFRTTFSSFLLLFPSSLQELCSWTYRSSCNLNLWFFWIDVLHFPMKLLASKFGFCRLNNLWPTFAFLNVMKSCSPWSCILPDFIW